MHLKTIFKRPRKKQRHAVHPLFVTVITNRATAVGHAAILEEFDIYIAEPVYSTIAPEEEDGHHQLDMDFSPFKFWKTNAHRFPLLAEVAK